MRSRNFRRLLWYILVIAWMGVIFFLSAQEAQTSSDFSGKAISVFARFFIRDYDDMPVNDQVQMINGLQHSARKFAHVFAYFVLGMLVMGAAFTHKVKLVTQIAAAFVVSVLYAVSDEIHQFFVPGRSSEITDVLIDAAGAAIGIAVITFMKGIRSKNIEEIA